MGDEEYYPAGDIEVMPPCLCGEGGLLRAKKQGGEIHPYPVALLV